MSEVILNTHSVPIDGLRIEGMSSEDIRNLPPTSGLLMHPDGRVEVIENFEERDANQRESAPPYKPVHPRSISLDSCVGDEHAASIGFYHQLTFPVDLEKLQSEGHWFVPTWTAPLYHGHVTWAYSLLITRRKQDGSNGFAIVCNRQKPEEDEAVTEGTKPLRLAPPPLASVKLVLNHPDKKNFDDLEVEGVDPDGWIYFANRYSEQQLRDLIVEGSLSVGLSFLVRRSYFSLASTIDLDAKPTVPAGAKEIVEAILRGEKPEGSDWEITGSHYAGDEDFYSVHKSAFASFSSKIEAAPDAAEVGLLQGLDDYGVRMAICIAYGVPVPLPERGEGGETKALVASLHALFGDHFTTVVAPQWELAICSSALALEMRGPLSSPMLQLLHLLNVAWSLPEDAAPVAKRIAGRVFADMAHLNACSSLQQWVHEEVMPLIQESGIDTYHVSPILEDFYKLMNIVPYVEKIALKAGGGFVDPAVLAELEHMKVKDEEEEEE